MLNGDHACIRTLAQYEQPNKNYKYTLDKALKNNLLGLLAGDFMYELKKGVGLHIVGRKQKKLAEKRDGETITETFEIKVEDAYFTNGLEERLISRTLIFCGRCFYQ